MTEINVDPVDNIFNAFNDMSGLQYTKITMVGLFQELCNSTEFRNATIKKAKESNSSLNGKADKVVLKSVVNLITEAKTENQLLSLGYTFDIMSGYNDYVINSF